MRHREEIIEDILDRIDQIFTDAMPSEEQQIKQREYIIPAEPLDEIMLILIPELEEIEQE